MSSLQKSSFISRNRNEVKDPEYFKSKIAVKGYCPESGDLSHDQIEEYWRMRFLEDVGKDLSKKNLLGSDRKEVQLV